MDLGKCLNFLVILKLALGFEKSDIPDVTHLALGESFSGSVSGFAIERIVEYSIPKVNVSCLRIHVFGGDSLTVVVRGRKSVISWSFPFMIKDSAYYSVNRTLCEDEIPEKAIISLSTTRPSEVQFRLRLYSDPHFDVSVDGIERSVEVSPSSPIYFRVSWSPKDPNIEHSLIKITSPDNRCMIASVQNLSCPVYDLAENINFRGYRQTLDTLTGLTVTREKFPYGFYLLFIVHTDNSACNSHNNGLTDMESKTVLFTISGKISRKDYLAATIASLAMFASFYFIFGIISCCACAQRRRIGRSGPLIVPSESDFDYGNTVETFQPSVSDDNAQRAREYAISSEDEDDDVAESSMNPIDADESYTLYKKFLFLSDLARRSPKALSRKSNLYRWNLLTIAIFYGLPVVQLMFTYQHVYSTSGDEDTCYYNFLCANPLGPISDFNHVWSNVGYILLGGLFMLITFKKDIEHREAARENQDVDTRLGIPKHFGIYYAMGQALIMEGVMSACYHVCPNHTNFQFDTAFMYTISILILLKIYHSRHPDINANAYKAFGTLAFIILLGVIGVLNESIYFWCFFACFHILSVLCLSINVYYMGQYSVDLGMFKRTFKCIKLDLTVAANGQWSALLPMFPDRMILMILFNLVNWSFEIYGIFKLAPTGGKFASFLLAVFIANVLLYTVFYIIMKLRYREPIPRSTFLCMFASFFTWIGAMYFFFNKSATWSSSASFSRHYNQECQILNFYDNHDIWHFLSATSLFLSFMILLTMDDKLKHVRRTEIFVF